MTQVVADSYSNVPYWLKKLTNAVNNILNGKINAISSVTLTANTTTTTVADLRCTASSVIILMPTTSNAAAALATTYITVTKQSFTITHANAASTDRTFNYAVLG